jgi:hypothetical protein
MYDNNFQGINYLFKSVRNSYYECQLYYFRDNASKQHQLQYLLDKAI